MRLHKSHDVRAFGRRAGEESRDSDSRFGGIFTEAYDVCVVLMRMKVHDE